LAAALAGFAGDNWLDKTPAERHASMTWMQRLKRVFNIDIETCERCAGHVGIIASIEDPSVIESANSTSRRIVRVTSNGGTVPVAAVDAI
jgi:hypothetical protein